VASEIFQKRLHQALESLEGLLTVHDDMAIYGVGETEEEAKQDHDIRLREFLRRCREKGVKLNKKKLKLRCSEIPYLGHLVTRDGLKLDPDKIKAITDMPKPEDTQAVRRFCGFVNYLARFMPHLANVLEPLRQLTHQDAVWMWKHEHDAAFEKIKSMVTTAPLLKFYNPEEELTIQCDASEKGLGAALMQNGQPIAFTSRALTDAETRYAQIEKEMLAVVYALQKFDQYAYGREVTIESDHKPLEAIATKPLRCAPKRLQGMLLKAQKYDISITYKPGAKMYLADTLSRAYLKDGSNPQGEFERINALKFTLFPEEKQDEMRTHTESDEVLRHLKEVIRSGWPNDKLQLSATLIPYFSYRDELTVFDGLIFRGDCLVIPKHLRQKMKAALHQSHIGVNGCLRRARECMFWPGMNAELKEFISHCETCQRYEMKQQKETLMSHELTDRLWERVGADIFSIFDRNYLVMVDYFSNFWEVDRLHNMRAITCIKTMKSHFARHGVPDVLISDNGPQFTSDEFAKFRKEWSFEHNTSSPGHQQANGKAEAAVKSAKRLMRKAKESGNDPYLAILAMRNTPTEGMDHSPAQRLLGRCCKTLLPTTATLLRPQNVPMDMVKKQMKDKQQKQTQYYNAGAKDLSPLEEGDTVRMRPFKLGLKTWDRATVSKRLDERSYMVETETGTYRRNRADLNKTATVKEPQIKIDLSNEVPTDPQNDDSTSETVGEELTSSNNAISSGQGPTPRTKRTTREPAYLKDYVRT
jgi:predicted Fe-S protein YdhL (DUF1289 family)